MAAVNRQHCTSLLLSGLCAVVAATVRCSPPKDRNVIAANEEYTVTAVGRIDRPDVRNTFEVSKRGQPFVTDAYLHWDSDSFEKESPIREWVATNALYVGDDRAARAPVHVIVVRNEASLAVKWMRVGAEDFFLVFDLAAGASITLPCRDWGGYYGFSAEGQFQNGRQIEHTSSVQAREPPRPVWMVVTDAGVAVSVQSP